MRFRPPTLLTLAVVLFVGSPASAEPPKPMATKVFCVADLVVPYPEMAVQKLLSCPPRGDGSKLQPTVTESGEKLVQLVTSMIRPYSWGDMGGAGKAEFFDLGFALVVNNSPEVIEEVSELLATLRRLQDRQLSTQVFVVSVPAGFCERIGLKCDATPAVSDRELRLLLEAAQAHREANVMQFPKVTTFDGQTATITAGDRRTFVTGVEARKVNGVGVLVPKNVPVDLGYSMKLCGRVSADQKFVKLQVKVERTTLGGPVELVPVVSEVTPIYEGGSQGQPVAFTQYLEAPDLKTVAVEKTVTVPTGGTVVLGGWKDSCEDCSQPLTSKVPYINRLFKNATPAAPCEFVVFATTHAIPCDAPVRHTEVRKMRNVAAVDAAAAVNQQLVKQASRMVVVPEPVSNTVLVSGEKALVQQVSRDLASMDVAPPQVHIQGLILEVPADWLADIGLKTEAGKPLVLTEREVAMFTAAIRRQKEKGDLDILSRPQMLVADNQTGFAQMGSNYPYVSRTDAAGKETIEYQPLGVSLRVIPRVNADGTLLLKVEHQHSTVSPTPINLGNGVKAPAFNVQSLQTTAKLHDGQTLVVCGGVSKTERVAATDDGQRKVDGEIRRQTVVVITPRRVKAEAARPAADATPASSPVVPSPPAPRR